MDVELDFPASKFRFLNLGCGANYHQNWVNVSVAPTGKGVIAADLFRYSILFPEKNFDLACFSH